MLIYIVLHFGNLTEFGEAMRYIVTGGSGFIGTNLVSRLKSLGHEVLSIDVDQPCDETHIHNFVCCDIRDYEGLLKIFVSFQPDVVFHLAARTDLAGKVLEDYSSNIVGVDSLCRVLLEVKVQRVIFASSMLVSSVGYKMKDPFDYCPSTVYGQSKVRTEQIILSYQESLPFFVIVRPTSIWGEWFKEPYRNFFDVVMNGRFFHPGSKAATKTYGYVGNAVNQLVSMALLSDPIHKVIYIGDEPAINVSDWANFIGIMHRGVAPRVFPFFVYLLLAKFGDFLSIFRVRFPMTSFRLRNMTTDHRVDCSYVESLNIFEKVPLDTAVRNTLSWLKRNG